MKKFFQYCLTSVTTFIFLSATAQVNHYHLVKTIHVGGSGGWDYLAVHDQKLYISHSTQVNVVDKESGDSIGVIRNTTGVHGIAFVAELHKGFTSNGKSNTISVFDTNNDSVLATIAVGANPDAIIFERFTRSIVTCNGRSNDLTLVDPSSGKVLATIPVNGKPETAVSDGSGNLFVNIEDKNEIARVDLKKRMVINRWPLAPAEGPTGLAYDSAARRLFAGCESKLVVMDATSGNIITRLPIGKGCDGVAYDAQTKTILTSNGEGTMSVVQKLPDGNYGPVSNVATRRGARTIALDALTHRVYMPTADFEAATPAGQRPAVKDGTFQVLVYGN